MHLDTTLNLVWVLLGLLALGSAIRSEFFGAKRTRGPRWLHVAGVALIVVALFPYISATDDILRIEHLSAQLDHSQSRSNSRTDGQKQNDDLIRLYETMDSPMVIRFCQLAFTFLFIAFVLTITLTTLSRTAPYCAGRSPPYLSV
ncbi:MAG TPA: hypothetical protein VH325_06810 [Bryobacteraceae bacterium]|nr:hypothetical protein [Bryobacteraceae bacterium]